MGSDRIQPPTPDQFSAGGTEGQPHNAGSEPALIHRAPKPVLPKDLPKALGYLDDQVLDRLLGAAIDEVKRRGRLPPGFEGSSAKTVAGSAEPISPPTEASSRPRRRQMAPPSLTRGQVNAVRAAFKAGITPSRIARQFGLTQSDVRKALAADDT